MLGATGAVGVELLRVFERRDFPLSELRLLASPRSAGRTLRFRGQDVPVEVALPDRFEGIDVALFSAGAARSRELAPHAVRAGAVVIDNSSAFRMDLGVPLVIPEVNLGALRPEHRVIANPNCTAILLLMAVHPLRKLAEIDRLIVSTYQSASGGGAALMQELLDQTRDALEGRPVRPKTIQQTYAFNLFSHNTPILENGENEEESKVVAECRKILDLPHLKINVTCVRVPVLRAHSESVTIEFRDAAPSEQAAREALRAAPGVRVIDDRAQNSFPTPLEASGQDDVLVGRIRKDPTHPNALRLFLCGDQLLKGAALNAVQIAEHALADHAFAHA